MKAIKAAAVQAAPVFMNLNESITKAEKFVAEAEQCGKEPRITRMSQTKN